MNQALLLNNDLVFKNNSAFAKLSLVKTNIVQSSIVADQMFHMISFNSSEITSNSHNYTPPIKSLSKLKFKFYTQITRKKQKSTYNNKS